MTDVLWLSSPSDLAVEDLTQRLSDLEARLKQCTDAAAAMEAEREERAGAKAAAKLAELAT